jgi:integrase
MSICCNIFLIGRGHAVVAGLELLPNWGATPTLHRELMKMLRTLPRGLPGVRVFSRHGKPIRYVREGFEAACHKTAIEGFTSDDLRHTSITDKDREGHSHSVIMASTGHETMSVFRRYRAVNREDLSEMPPKVRHSL